MDDETTGKNPASGASSEEPLAPAAPVEPEQPVVEEPQEPVVAPLEPEEPKPTRAERREERHIERLTEQIQRGFAQREGYREQLIPPARPYQPLKYEETEYDAAQLEADRRAYGESRYQEGAQLASEKAQQEFFVDRLERDGDYIASHYPKLDESSEDFDPDMTDEINRLYLAAIGYNAQTGAVANSGIRYRDFAKAQMSLLDRVATSRSAETATNVARQSGRAGVRPTGSPRRNQVGDITDPRVIASMSAEEYEQNRDRINATILDGLGQ